MNSVVVSGLMAKDINGNKTNKVGTSQLAVKRPYPYNKTADGKEAVDFLNLKFIGEKNVIKAAEWLTKGTPVIIEGHYFKDSRKREDGMFEYYDYIMVSKWEFQQGKKPSQDQESVVKAEPKEEKETAPPLMQAPDGYFTNMEDIDTDLPFIK